MVCHEGGVARRDKEGNAEVEWCGRGDSNPHDIAIASPSSWCVWHLHSHSAAILTPKLSRLGTEPLPRHQCRNFPAVEADFDPAVALASELTLHRFPAPYHL